MTAKKTSSKKAAAPKRAAKKAAPKKVTDPKTVVVDKPPKAVISAPRHRKTGEKYKAPKLVRKQPLTREEQAAFDRVKIKGQ